MMIIKYLLQVIDKHVPFSSSESWDNVGLLIGNQENEVNGILTALDCTNEVVDEAIEQNINTIIAHHPLIFKGVQNITNDSYGPIIRKLIQNDIQLIDRKSTRLNSSHVSISYAVFCLKKKNN